ncbi:MAG: hypothetical protein HW391_1938 [Chloroflexi bacterium]|nr:hypothetical protein [Chloroflexota bacterium]
MDLFLGLRLSSTPTSPNWNDASTSATRLPASEAAATARLTASVVRPTPPFGLKMATTVPGSPAAGVPAAPAVVVAAGTAYRLRLSRSRVNTCRIDAVSSSELNGLTRNSRAPASMDRRR